MWFIVYGIVPANTVALGVVVSIMHAIHVPLLDEFQLVQMSEECCRF